MVLPFTIEADHPRNADLLLQSIPNCRLRSRIIASRTVKLEDGSEVIPKDQARHLGSLPPLPGMLLAVDPKNLSYVRTDPMHGDKDLCSRLHSALRADERRMWKEKMDGIPPLKGTLDVHRMKTLCRELMHIIKNKQAIMHKGVCPDIEDIEDMPGKILLNPGSTIPNSQPEYEEDFENWKAHLSRIG